MKASLSCCEAGGFGNELEQCQGNWCGKSCPLALDRGVCLKFWVMVFGSADCAIQQKWNAYGFTLVLIYVSFRMLRFYFERFKCVQTLECQMMR